MKHDIKFHMEIKIASRKLGLMNSKTSNSFFLTLPKLWVEALGLDKGKMIDCIVDDDKNLVLKPVKQDETKSQEAENLEQT